MQLLNNLLIFYFFLLLCQLLIATEIEPLVEVTTWCEDLREQKVQ
jgi:hypothetical protein